MSQVQQQQQPQQQQQQPPQQSPQSQQQQPQQEYRKSSGPYNQQGEYPGFGGVESNQLIRLAPRPGEKIVRRLGVYVVGAEGVPPREGKIQAVMAEVSCAGKSYTTSAVKDLSPRWNSLYRFSLRNGCVRENILRETSPGTLLISVWIRSFKNKLVGSATVDIGALPLETVVEQTLVLNPNGVSQHQQQHQKQQQQQQQQQPQNGGTNKCTVRVRLHVGTLVYEARGLSAVRIIDPIFDYPYLDKKDEVVPFKPGDIILYNFPGHISAAAKLRTGMQWSHCGIVALLPKKWCGRQSLSIIEFSRNLELFRDMYAEWPLHNGVVIYNLEERLHGVPGTEVWHLPLKAKYFDDVYARNLRNWALEIHDNFIKQIAMFKGKHLKLQFEGPIAWSDTEINFLKTFGTDVKDTTEFCELYSAQMCACALKKCFGLRFKHPFMEIPDLIQSGYFAQPYLVRCRPEHSSNIYWPGTCAKRLPSTASPMTPLNTDANTSSLSPVTPKHSPKKKKDVVADSSSNNNCTNSSSSGSSSSSSSANGIDNSDTSSSSTSINDDENNSNAINTNSGIYPHLPPPGVSLLVPSPPGYVSGYGSGSSGSGGSSASPMLAQPPPQQQQQQQQPPFVAADDFRQDIELLDQQIAAEYQTLCDIAAIQPRIPSGYVSEFLAIQSEIQGLHNGFNALKTAALTSGVPLSESQRKEAQVMADRHNELTAQMEVLVTKVNSGPGGDYDVPQEELQKEGNRQLDLLNSQLTIGAESLQKMDAIRPLVTPQIQQRYDMIYRALQFAYSRYSELKNHIMTTHQILDDSQLQEAQKISEYQNSAWIDMKLLCQELHV